MAKTIKGITIKIGGDTVNLGKALDKVEKESRAINSELYTINRQLKFNPSSTVLLSQKQEVLEKNISNSKEKLKELEAVQQDIERAYKNGEIDDGQYRAYQREVEQTKHKLEGYERELKSAKNNQAEFDRKVEQARQTIEANKTSLKAGIKTVGKYGAAVVGALGAAAGAAIKYASEFETAFAKTTTLLDEKKIDYDKYKKEIIKVSNETGVAAKDIAESTYDAISASVDPKHAVQFVKQANKLSKGGFTEIAQSVDILTTIMNAYQMKVKNTTHISDVLLQTQNKGKVLVGELAQYMGKVIPVAAGYSVSLENVASGYAILTARGIKAAQSTTYMKSLFDELAKVKYDKNGAPASLGAKLKELTGKTFAELMKSGKSVGDVLDILYKSVGKNNTAFGALFSKSNARAAAMSLVNAGAKKFNATLKDMKNSTGAADAAYDKMANTAAHKTEVLKTNIQNSAIAIGDGMLPVVNDLLEYIEKNLPEIQKIAQDLGVELGKDLKWILENGDKIIADIKTITTIGGSLYAAFKLKQFITTIGETVAAIRILKSATTAAEAAQIALNTAQAANVIGAVCAGLVVLTGLVWAAKDANEAYTKATSIWTAEDKKLFEQIESEAKALKEAKEARQENIAGIENEYQYYQDLYDELDKIVDKNGKIKDGYEERAKFIATTLKDKLGVEIELNKDVITGYKKVREEIKKTIKAKKEEAKLKAYEGDYEKAIKSSSSDLKNYNDLLIKRKDAEKKLAEATETRANIIRYVGKGYQNPVWTQADNAVKQAEDDLNKVAKATNEAWNTYATNYTLIQNYENASAAIISGKHETAKTALEALTEEIILAGEATNEQAGILLQKQYDKAYKSYNEIKAAYKNGEKGITKTMVDQAEKRLNAAEEQLNIYSQNVGEEAKNAASNVGKNFTKTDTQENKEKAQTRAAGLKKPILKGFSMTDKDSEEATLQGERIVKAATKKEVKEKAKSKANKLGNNFVKGFILALAESGGSVYQAAWNFIKSALFGAKKAQKSNSPSKETEKLSEDYAAGYIINLNKRQKDAYIAGKNFTKKAVAGAQSVKLAQAEATANINYNFSSSANAQLEGVARSLQKDNTPKVYTSSPVITLQFGDVKVQSEQDINALSDAISYKIADEIVSTNRARGG